MQKNKKAILFLLVFFVAFSCVFSLPLETLAGGDQKIETTTGGLTGAVIDGFLEAVKWLLYNVIFVPVTWIATGAIALFAFATDASMLSGPTGLLNTAPVYELWKFIRDFFNLFFIFSLLLVAFSTVFQIEKYSIKKMLLSIVLAALFVNFSFPIARFLIDVSNVPMYFFAKQMMGGVSTGSFSDAFASASLGATGLENTILPKGYAGATVSGLLLAIIFMFLFSITLMVLALMFVVRLAALIVLVIFSPIGFVAAAIPIDSLKGYSKQWWDNFNKYLIFGPVAMLMLLVTVRFMGVIQTSVVKQRAASIAGNVTGGVDGPEGLARQLILFSIPMIMIWMTISISNKMGIAGAKTVEGWGNKVRGWGQGLAMGAARGIASPVTTRARGFGSGLKERAENTNGVKLFTPKYWNDKKKETEVLYKGLGKGGREGMQDARAGLDHKKIYETADENKKNNVNNSELITALSGGDKVRAAAAAITLADRKAISTPEQLKQAVAALGNNTREINKVIENARGDALNFGKPEDIASLLNSEAFAEKDEAGKAKKDAAGNYVLDEQSDMYKDFKSKMKKEGKVKIFADYRIKTEVDREAAKGTGPVDERKIRNDVYKDTINKLSVDDLAKQGSIHGALADDANLREYMKEYADKHKNNYHKAMEKMSAADQDKWTNAGVVPEEGQKKTSDESASIREKLREVGRQNGRRS